MSKKIKVSKVGQSDVYVPTYDSDGKTLTVESVVGPGAVPLGGMVAVMPHVDAAAWQPPATGVIKDGFMRADGTVITSAHVSQGCKFSAGATLPSMMAKYPRGNTTSGTTGGSNLYTPAGTNAASNVPASGLSFSGTSASYSVSVPAHYHGFSLTASTGINLAHGHGFRTNWAPANTYLDNNYMATADVDNRYLGATSYSNTNTVLIENSGTLDHSHSVAGSVGFTTGSNGNLAFTASGSNTPAGSITGTATAAAQAFTGTQASNEPAYIEVIWVIRVK